MYIIWMMANIRRTTVEKYTTNKLTIRPYAIYYCSKAKQSKENNIQSDNLYENNHCILK